jgi:hypothetical protein
MLRRPIVDEGCETHRIQRRNWWVSLRFAHPARCAPVIWITSASNDKQ